MFTATEIIAMSAKDLGTYCAGGYGPKRREEMVSSIKRLALAETSHRDQIEAAKGEIRGLFGRKP